jgi:hypothetical protein
MSEYTFKSKNSSGIESEMEVTREDVRAIKEMCESTMRERGDDEDIEIPEWKYPLGGSKWTDLMELRQKCKKFLRENQTG